MQQHLIGSLDDIPHLIRVPLVRQGTNYTCGVAALQSVLAYYGHAIREDKLAQILDSGPEHGTNYHWMADYARSLGFAVDILVELPLHALCDILDSGSPAILAIQAWSDNPARYADDWDDGHYVVAVGHDARRIYFMDPSTLGNYTYIEHDRLVLRWHDKYFEGADEVRLHHFAMVIRHDVPAYDPQSILPMG